MAGAAALTGAAYLPFSTRAAPAGESKPILIEARPGSASLLETPDDSTSIWGYGGHIPGPEIRVKQGEEVWVRLKNSLPQPTTIHWHGIRIDNAMDGVAGLTQKAVPPGETFDYRFTAPDAGTYWYHPHNRSWEQLARGLYGPLIVEEPESLDIDQDIIVVADDWLLDKDGKLHEQSFGSLHERAHAGRLGNVLTLNGAHIENIPVKSGERIRLRLCNSCNARILELQLEDVAPQVMAIDGQPVTPYMLEDAKLVLAPAQRIDLLINMTGKPGSSSAITEVSAERLVAGLFIYHKSKSRGLRKKIIQLPSNNLPVPDTGAVRQVDLVMTGGAMGQLEKAVYKGKELPIRDLARTHGMVWAFNGIAGMASEPLFSAKKGETIAIRMINRTRWPHAIHIHGHHFREIEKSPSATFAVTPSPWRDTILVSREETRTVHFVADNPGKWMIHCHMLEHQAGGMGTWFTVGA